MKAGVGSRGGNRQAKWLSVLLMTTAVTSVAGVPLAHAQNSPSPMQTASAAAQRDFNIPAQSLTTALVQFGQQSGQQVTANGDLIRSLSARTVRGRMTPGQALSQLLAGTGLTYTMASGGTLVLQRATSQAADGAMTLPPVQVEGQTQDAQSPYGPGVGYVATRSVVGTKSDTPIIETPQSISVVTRKQMDDQQPQNLNDALRYTAGIVPEMYGVTAPSVEGGLRLRGFAPEVYVDGLQDDDAFGIDPYLLDRIEVLGGPASVLYGQASPGGLVNMSSKLPTTNPIHELELGGGSYGHYQGAFDFSGPLNQDGTLLYRLTGIGYSENSQVNYTKSQEVAIAPAITWRPDANTSFTLLGKYMNDPATGPYSNVPAVGSVLPNPNGKIPTSFFVGDQNFNTDNYTYASVGYQLDHKFNNVWSFRQNFLFQHVTETQEGLYPKASGITDNDTTLNRYAYSDQNWNSDILIDNQFHAKFQTGALLHDITFGLDYQHHSYWDAHVFNRTADVPSIDIFNPSYDVGPIEFDPSAINYTRQTDNQLGVYAQDQVSLNHWHFLMGARGDWANQTSTTTVDGAVGSTNPYNSSAPSWRVGMVYLFDNGLAPYVSYSTSFQPQEGTTINNAPLIPTTGQQYEVGIKYQPPGSNSFITASLFNLTEQNVPVTDPGNENYDIQIGEVRSRGIELSGHASLTANLDVLATYTYTDVIDAKDTSADTGIGINGTEQPLQGKALDAIPHNMASVWVNYTFHEGPMRGFGIGGGVRYIGWTYGDDVSSFKVPGFVLADAVVHYDLGQADPALKGWKLQVNATNLFNNTYVASCTSANYCYYGEGRSVFANLKYDW